MGANRGPGAPVSEDVASSFRWGFGQYAVDESLVRRYWLSPTPDGSVDPEGIADAYRDEEVQSQLAADGESVAVRQDGDVVEVGVLDPIEEAGGGVEPPLVVLDVTLDGQTATIRHVAGDPVPLSRVTVRADSDRVEGLGDGTLSPGSSRSVDVPSGTETVRVIYAAPNDESRMVLAES